MVEHSAVNRVVVGSSPTRGVLKNCEYFFIKELIVNIIEYGDLAKW